MFRRFILLTACCCGATASAGPPTNLLQPLQNWILDYREDQCVATRDFGSAGNPVTLGIRPAPNGETYELMVALKRPGPKFALEKKGSVDFGNGAIKAWLLNYGGTHSTADVYQFRISAAEMGQAQTAKVVTLRASGLPEVDFPLASMPALLKGLQECTADLQRYWNMTDKNVIATDARGDLRELFHPEDYPAEAMKKGQEGRVRFLLLVNETGRVAGCHVLEPSGIPVLDAMGCQVLRTRGQFTPARDASGKAVRTAVTTPAIIWVLSGPPPQRKAEATRLPQ